MKFLILAISFCLVALSAHATEKQVTVLVDGMTCPSCAASVEQHLKSLPQVKSVNISLSKGSVKIELKEGSFISDSEISKAVKDAGYKVKSVQFGNGT
jgi:copper chaperone CopZ